jgi:hypothetical protein
MDPTRLIAWIGVITGSIGSITGTSALLWDLYKWKHRGPELLVTVVPGMFQIMQGVKIDDERLFRITVVNSGSSKTTLTALGFFCFPTKPNKKLTKPVATENFIVTNPLYGNFPHVLETGEQWTGFAKQDAFIEELARTGYLYAQVYHSLGKAASGRVVIKTEELTPR